MRSCPVCGGVCKGNDERCAVAYRLQSLAADAHDQEVEQRRAELSVVPPEDEREPVQESLKRRGQ